MQKSNRPILFEKKEDCCGCTACFAVCPMHAISMEPEVEGFLYPRIDEEKCIMCYQCERICPLRKLKSGFDE